jgi:hypothetical protein
MSQAFLAAVMSANNWADILPRIEHEDRRPIGGAGVVYPTTSYNRLRPT